MSMDLLKATKKQNNNKSGIKADKKKRRKLEAETRQADYDKLTADQKLAQTHLGAKEKAKLLLKRQNQTGATK